MDAFKYYMDKIKAENELKEKTKAFVNSAIRYEIAGDKEKKREKTFLKRIFIAAASVAACAMLAIGGYAYYNAPVNYVSVDINPSIELGINRFGIVVTSESYNEDGDLLLKEAKLTRMSLKEALDILINKAAENGYIAEDGSTVIAVTSESDDEETAAELQETSEEAVSVSLSVKNLNAIVYADCSSLELRTEAKELGISPGKYKLVATLQAINPEIDINDYKNAKITDIIVNVDLQMSEGSSEGNGEQNGQNDKAFDKALEKMAKAAEKVKTARGNSGKGGEGPDPIEEQEQEQNSNKGSGGTEQEQNTNQNSDNAEQEQELQKNKGSDISEQNKNKNENKAPKPLQSEKPEVSEDPETSRFAEKEPASKTTENGKQDDSSNAEARQPDKGPDANLEKPKVSNGSKSGNSAGNEKAKEKAG